MNDKILIAVPCFDTVHADFMESVTTMKKPENSAFTVVKNTLIHDARDIIAQNAVIHDFDYVLYLDSDMRFPADMVSRLLADIKEGYDLVSGLYFTRKSPCKPNAFSKLTWHENADGSIDTGCEWLWNYTEGLNHIKACGFGCCMVTTELLNRVGETFKRCFQPLDGFGEDMSFCIRADQLGAKMVLDARIKCDHIGTAVYNEALYKAQGGKAAFDK